MTILNDIQRALIAHGNWKERLNEAIETGQSEISPEQAGEDNLCEFGKWLYGENVHASQKGRAYDNVRESHAQFHKIAGCVLELALDGKPQDAKQLVNGAFRAASSELVGALLDWKKDIEEKGLDHVR